MLMIISFVVALTVLITVHEFGHFQTARWCGVKVLKFSLGFGKPLYVKKIGKDRTEFMISAIPLLHHRYPQSPLRPFYPNRNLFLSLFSSLVH